MSDLPSIEHGGVMIKPKSGVYRCPYKCGTKGYPAPKWKTEKGFRKHLENCYMRPSELKKRSESKAKRDEAEDAKKEARAMVAKRAVDECGRSIGDLIHYVYSRELKPTHIQRGSRMVRVRYEAVIAYYSSSAHIVAISWSGSYIYNGNIYERNIFESKHSAESVARARTLADEESRKQSSMLR